MREGAEAKKKAKRKKKRGSGVGEGEAAAEGDAGNDVANDAYSHLDKSDAQATGHASDASAPAPIASELEAAMTGGNIQVSHSNGGEDDPAREAREAAEALAVVEAAEAAEAAEADQEARAQVQSEGAASMMSSWEEVPARRRRRERATEPDGNGNKADGSVHESGTRDIGEETEGVLDSAADGSAKARRRKSRGKGSDAACPAEAAIAGASSDEAGGPSGGGAGDGEGISQAYDDGNGDLGGKGSFSKAKAAGRTSASRSTSAGKKSKQRNGGDADDVRASADGLEVNGASTSGAGGSKGRGGSDTNGPLLDGDAITSSAAPGLENKTGQHSCFVNVVVQTLWNVSAFRDAFSAEMPQEQAREEDQSIFLAMREVRASCHRAHAITSPRCRQKA